MGRMKVKIEIIKIQIFYLYFLINREYNNKMDNYIISHQDVFGVIWSIGWLFTIGYLKLSFWKGVLALIVWPYYLGVKFGKHNN